MKTPLPKLFILTLAPAFLLAVGCAKEVETEDVVTTPPPSSEAAEDHDHDHKHGPTGLPVVEADDGTEIEWGFNEDEGAFLVIPPADLHDSIEEVVIKTVTEGNEKTYTLTFDQEEDGWILVDQELGTAMMMGDAVERTLVITGADGKVWTAAVAHVEGH